MTSVYTFKRSFGLPVIYCDTAVKVFNFFTEIKLFHVICISPGIYTFRIAYKKVMCLNYRDKQSEKVSILFSYQSILKLLIILYQKKENQLFVSVSIQFDQNIQHLNEEFLVPRKWFQIKKQY